MNGGYWESTLRNRISRRRMLAGTAGLGAGALALSLVGCGGDDGEGDKVSQFTPQDTTNKAVRGGIMQSQYASEPTHYDPISGTVTNQIHGMHAYSRLMKNKVGTFDEPTDGSLEPDAAVSWEVVNNGLQINIKLRQGMKYDQRAPTNGRVMTSADVKYSWERLAALAPHRGNFIAGSGQTGAVESVEFPDASTVVFKLAFPSYSILSQLAYRQGLFILPVEAEDKFDFKQEMRGTGPWMMTKYTPSSGWEYRRNPNWYDADKLPYLDGIDYALISEPAQALAQLKAKKLWWYEPTADTLPSLMSENQDLQVLGRTPLSGNGGYTILGLSKKPDSPLQKDVRLRQAISMLIDRDLFIDTFYNVEGLTDLGLPVDKAWHSHTPCSWPSVWLDPQGTKLGEGAKNFKFDPEEAAKLLRAANAFGSEHEFNYHSDQGAFGGANHQKQMEVFAEMLQAGGHFKLKTVTGPYTTFFQPGFLRAKGDFNGIAPVPSGSFPDFDLQMWNNYSPGSRNDSVGAWENVPGMEALMKKHRQEFDDEKRVVIAQDWQKLMAKEMPTVPYPGLASIFTTYWPWLGNAGVYQAFGSTTPGNQNNPYEADVYFWYDKSKDTNAT